MSNIFKNICFEHVGALTVRLSITNSVLTLNTLIKKPSKFQLYQKVKLKWTKHKLECKHFLT